MKCPVDNTELAMADRQGIEVDYCPKCRGVWLDRGELDKIIERSADDRPAAPQQAERPRHRDDDDRHRDDRHYGSQQQPYRKKKSLLGELFDF
jgi:Zn-finger nucleic acid-binding protein